MVYQTTWLREFRLIFGASTAACAAVLGIFMGGIAAGSAVLGRRSETKTRPLAFYAKLELLIGVAAAATPLLISLIRPLYLAMGGTQAMGPVFGTIVRLLFAAVAIGPPTFLMGGTLPAVARAAVPRDDTNRRSLALLYGINTLGAVVGAAAATFYFFEHFGNHFTLLSAAILNVAVAGFAFWISRSLPAVEKIDKRAPGREIAARAPARFVYVAAGIAGFAFLLMELVWYRMLSPLLGGSAFTFGLILAVALFGIALGGVLCGVFGARRRASLNGFAFVCALEALFIALPYALGDRIALATMLLRPLGSLGFYGYVIYWTVICAVVALPAAIISGIQFPMLLSLLGEGRHQVGSQIGKAYAWNTGGAILGSLAGGFGLLPAFSAPGVWKLVVICLCLLAGASTAVVAARRLANSFAQIPALGTAILALCLLTTTGPTAFWRHGQVGVGRLSKLTGSKAEYHDLMNFVRRDILWEADGVESSVALSYSHGINFVVNGRCDGHSTGDAGTQIMCGLIGAALHPEPKRALVVGLGTGSTAGWLAAVPSMEHVDVVELEPSIIRVAEACADVNHQALRNPKLRVIIGDGREVLLTSREKYDLISSEPSNPYRAGIASLFTREYYQAAAGALNPGGLFAQWVQAYEIDTPTIETIYATLGSVFPNIDTWQTESGDLLFVASAQRRSYDLDALRAKVATEPFKSALINTWGVTSLEGFLAHFVADNSLAQGMQRLQKGPLNSDDRTTLEFAFARNVDLHDGSFLLTVRGGAKVSRSDRLSDYKGEVNWDDVERNRLSMLLAFGETLDLNKYADAADRSLIMAWSSYAHGEFSAALQQWRQHPREPVDLNELRMVAECLADQPSADAIPYIEKLRKFAPTDADEILAHLLLQRGDFDAATDVLEKVFHQLRSNPWPHRELTDRTLTVADKVLTWAQTDVVAQRLHSALQFSFSVFNSEEQRRMLLLRIGIKVDKGVSGPNALAAVESVEPYVPWQIGFLKTRKDCYAATGSPRLKQAERDLAQFEAEAPPRLEQLAFQSEVPVSAGEAPVTPSANSWSTGVARAASGSGRN